ncbi:MAG: HAMP domain-containing histidine kinase [Clostridia bacterium]|nr:HAMP domain-containing histidine kinase [Clostridia bacterium]
MTKKKMIIYTLVGILVLYSCGVAMIVLSSFETEAKNMHQYFNYLQNLDLVEYYNGYKFDFPEIHKKADLSLNIPSSSKLFKPGYSYAFYDEAKNIVFESSSTVWYYDFDTKANYYFPLDEYMTPEIKAKILKFQKSNNFDSIRLVQMEVNLNTEPYRPVSLTFTNGQVTKTFVISYDIRTHTLLEADGNFICRFYDLDEKSSVHRNSLKAQSEIEKAIENAEFSESTTSSGGGFFSFNSGELDYHKNFDDYHFIVCVRFNPLLMTVTTDNFRFLFGATTVLFAVVGTVILIFAVKVFNKNQKIKENQRAFTSAVAHEMKTPLAVIQNQCECFLDGVAPHKNEQYVRSVYDEAVKMNGMVQSFLMFNRLSDLVSLKSEKCNLSDIVLTQIAKHEKFALVKGMAFKTDIAPDVFVSGNAELLAMAVGNYISNSVKHSQSETEIKITLACEGKSFIFETFNVSEPIEDGEDVWSVLTKGDASRGGSEVSSGMGLPICKRIFELHKMEHGYNNEENGIRFFFKGKIF